jgi:hypothetical protein
LEGFILTQASESEVLIGRMREIAELLSITDDEAISDIEKFWQTTAAAIGVPPSDDVISTAKRVVDNLSDWDDDFLTENGLTLADSAYGEVLAVLNQRTNSGAIPFVPDDHQLELEDDVDDVSWARYEMGVGRPGAPFVRTLLEMIFDKEIVLNPQWQRNFVWTAKKQRRFIESILMGLPIPSLMFHEQGDNEQYVVDGRQRLETLARFCATPEQRAELGFIGKRFKTFGVNEAGWRPGEDLHEAAGKYFSQLPVSFQRRILSTPFMIFTFKDLQPRQLYQIFQRYNTGADKLRAAEIRNAVYQSSSLHKLLWRLAGESPDTLAFDGDDEEYCAGTLRNVMRNKTSRYGAYDFLGRVMAFTYLDNGKSVAAATNDFMDAYAEEDQHEMVRDKYLATFEKVSEWYQFPFTTPEMNGRFHNFMATIQMATTHHLLDNIDANEIEESDVKSVIDSTWMAYATETLEMKQNSGAYWERQKKWERILKGETYPSVSTDRQPE